MPSSPPPHHQHHRHPHHPAVIIFPSHRLQHHHRVTTTPHHHHHIDTATVTNSSPPSLLHGCHHCRPPSPPSTTTTTAISMPPSSSRQRHHRRLHGRTTPPPSPPSHSRCHLHPHATITTSAAQLPRKTPPLHLSFSSLDGAFGSLFYSDKDAFGLTAASLGVAACIHEEMLKDVARTKTYQNVIYKNKHLYMNKIVHDVGPGTGILSLFCAKDGAKHVYVIEYLQMDDMANKIVKANGYSNVITVLKGKADEIDLLHVNDGIVLPDNATLHLTTIEDSKYKDDKIECKLIPLDIASVFQSNPQIVFIFIKNCLLWRCLEECIRQTCNDADAETIVKYLEVLKDEHIKPGDAALYTILPNGSTTVSPVTYFAFVSILACEGLEALEMDSEQKRKSTKEETVGLVEEQKASQMT
ncbi:probable protein arginine N-methyltransferase 1 [Tanacetum coccineum]